MQVTMNRDTQILRRDTEEDVISPEEVAAEICKAATAEDLQTDMATDLRTLRGKVIPSGERSNR